MKYRIICDIEEFSKVYKESKKIIIMSGAGVSTNSGIPDYRTMRGTSIFRNNHSIEQLKADTSYSAFEERVLNAKPTEAHYLAVRLHKEGRLKRVFTQNIDGLYQKAGLPEEMVVEFHGSLIKGDIVLEGMEIPDQAVLQVIKDFDNDVDLTITMGTSLQVAPFCSLPNILKCSRALVDYNPSNAYHNDYMQKTNHGVISYCKFGKRKITCRPTWLDRKKPTFILAIDCDQFASLI